MKKSMAIILSVVFLISMLACVPAFAEGEAQAEFTPPPLLPYVKMYTNAVAVFAAPEAQPFPLPFGDEPDMLDTIWIFYGDGTFDQYAEVNRN